MQLAVSMRTFSFCLLSALLGLPSGVFGQKLSLGIVAGGSLTDAFPTTTVPVGPEVGIAGFHNYSQAKDYIVGPAIEFKLSGHWSIEADGLYRKLHFTTSALLFDGTLNSVSPSPVITWEFPVLAKYRFHFLHLEEFAEAGPSFRTAGNLNGTSPSHQGATAGLGFQLHAGKIGIAPELRYTRWAADNWQAGYQSNPNQLELLVAVSDTSATNLHPLGLHSLIGVTAGTALTNTFPATNMYSLTISPLRSLIAGPTFEIALPKHFAVEADVLSRPSRLEESYTYNAASGPVTATYSRSTGTWEGPILVKYRLPGRILQPFVEGGPAFLFSGNFWSHGVAAGAGVEKRLGLFRIAPLVRFSRWAAEYPVCSFCGTNQNQVEVLLSFSM